MTRIIFNLSLNALYQTYIVIFDASIIFQGTAVRASILCNVNRWVIVGALAPTQQIAETCGNNLKTRSIQMKFLPNSNKSKFF